MGGIWIVKLLERIKIDLILKSRNDSRKAVLSLLEPDEDAQVLDLGCGEYERLSGNVKDRIGTRYPLHGIDIHVGGTRGDILVFQGDLNDTFPLEPAQYDVVTASQVIEHLWNTDGFLKEIYRVLKPTGYAVISTPNLAAWHNRLYLLFGKQPEPCKVSEEMYPEMEKPGHLRIFTARELVKLLKFHGFTIEKVIKTFGTVTIKVRKE
ncbi:MAG: class I SAM-dependent methyltransferase [Thaumarchaeota archaeon]|nr:MAG: class I SAM-dependent methyltransferase [Nitrososphaerota archaeon]